MERRNIYDSLLGIITKFERRKNPTQGKINKPEIITAPKGAKYLSDFLHELPPNTFINKSTTGVGATTMALESEDKFIVAVPYQSLALNKKTWCDQNDTEVLIVKQGVKAEDIANFNGSKILVVFDSLWKLTKHLKNPETFRLMVDEVHVVLTSASFRGKGMNSVLEHFEKFMNFVLITATPTPELYNLESFKEIRRIDIEWPKKEKINFVRDIVTKDDEYTVEDKLLLISRRHLKKEIDSNAYFFVNSIRIINRVVKALIKLGLVTSDDVNLIVAEVNSAYLKVNLGRSYSIGRPPSLETTPKKLNFITSTAFEGSDFYDENGKIYIVSDGSQSHTKIDILTQLHQIAGRIRNSKLNNSIQIITVPSPILEEKNMELFEAQITTEYETQQKYLVAQNMSISVNSSDVGELIMQDLLSKAELNPHFIIDNGFVEMNKLYIPSQIHNWKVLHQSYVYKLNGSGEIEVSDGDSCGVDFIDKKISLPPKAIGKALLGRNYNFREMAVLYSKARREEATKTFNYEDLDEHSYPLYQNMSDLIGELQPLLHEAHRILGAEGIANLDYNKSDIEKAIDKTAPVNNVAKYLKIKNGWYSNKVIKQKIQNFYDKTNPSLKAKATDISKFYIAKNCSKRILGKPVKGIKIMGRIRKSKAKVMPFL